MGRTRSVFAVQKFVTTAYILLLPSLSWGYAVNDGVLPTTTNVNVRSGAATSNSILYTVSPGDSGLIVSGPTVAGGYTWWYINWASHPTQNGWTADANLTLNSPAPVTVFTDYYNYDWHIRAWSNSAVSLSTSNYRVETGRVQNASLEVGISAAYARLYIETTAGFSTSGSLNGTLQSLHLSVQNVNVDGRELYVGLSNTSGTVIHYVPAWNYVPGGSLNQGTWYDLVIPIADLQATNMVVTGVVVEQEVPGTFRADEISFSTTYGSTYWNPSTITGVNATCNNITIAVGQSTQCAASVSGTGSYSSAVTWGASSGSMMSSGLYTAPSTVPNPATISVAATSYQDPTKTGFASITITNTSISQADSTPYAEGLGAGWSLAQRPNIYPNLYSADAYIGTYAMQTVIAATPWGRTQLLTQPNYKFNTSGNNYLAFAVNVGGYDTRNLYVGLFDASKNIIHYVMVSSYLPGQKFVSYQWQVVNIPLADLVAVGVDTYGIEIQSDDALTFSVDNLKFSAAGGCN
jgi:hypothetical protein